MGDCQTKKINEKNIMWFSTCWFGVSTCWFGCCYLLLNLPALTPLQIWSNFPETVGSVGLEFSMGGWGGGWL